MTSRPPRMKPFLSLFPVSVATFSIACGSAAAAPAQDWPGWRGPTKDGQAPAGQSVPIKWGETEHVLWQAPLRGRGHSSPTVAGNRVYVTTADSAAQEQLVICLDRATGKPVWETVVHRGKLVDKGHRNASQASATPAWDGELLYVNFLNDEAIYTTALDSTGKIVWQQRVAPFQTHQGFGSS